MGNREDGAEQRTDPAIDPPERKVPDRTSHPKANEGLVDSSEDTLRTRFPPPQGYERVKLDSPSFASFLRNLPLKPSGSPVRYYDGRKKGKPDVRAAVVDMPIGDRDLHQCADAVIRLRAEHFYQRKAYDRISFEFTDGTEVPYRRWRKGERVVVDGTSTYWKDGAEASQDRANFEEYLRTVYTYAGSLSLSRELDPVPMEDAKVGDVLIEGGSPGHAVIVVDRVEKADKNEKLFLLAQSYMPAQEIHILDNPSDSELSPWYRLEPEEPVRTPEWTFQAGHLKRFPER